VSKKPIAPWQEPKTIEEARARYDEHVQRLQEVQAQLADRDRLNENGERMSSEEYWQWRSKAHRAFTFLSNEVRRLKMWIKAHHTRLNRHLNDHQLAGMDLTTDEGLVLALTAVIKRLASDGVDLDPEEQEIVDVADRRIRHGWDRRAS
jgi:hypothetical protein